MKIYNKKIQIIMQAQKYKMNNNNKKIHNKIRRKVNA